jgi:hypothetical protein
MIATNTGITLKEEPKPFLISGNNRSQFYHNIPATALTNNPESNSNHHTRKVTEKSRYNGQDERQWEDYSMVSSPSNSSSSTSNSISRSSPPQSAKTQSPQSNQSNHTINARHKQSSNGVSLAKIKIFYWVMRIQKRM